MTLVLDSSVALAWIYPDETTDPIREVFAVIAESGAFVPALWRLEVANGLTLAMRRGRIDEEVRAKALADFLLLDISIDEATDSNAWNATLRLADRFSLTVYDAAYLELAQRQAFPLASLDRALRAAAAGAGVSVLGA
jgi:predicted nucleic acid-binding protein